MKLRLIYKKILNTLFILRHGKVTKSNKKIKNLKIFKINKINRENLSKYKYRLYNVKNGRVFTDYVENVSIIQNNQLIENASFQQINGTLRNEIKTKLLSQVLLNLLRN